MSAAIYQLEHRQGLPVMPWPDLPDGVRDVATHLTRVIEEQRRADGQAPSVREEELLLENVTSLVYKVIESPTQFGIQPMTQQRLRSEENYRSAVLHAPRARASR